MNVVHARPDTRGEAHVESALGDLLWTDPLHLVHEASAFFADLLAWRRKGR